MKTDLSESSVRNGPEKPQARPTSSTRTVHLALPHIVFRLSSDEFAHRPEREGRNQTSWCPELIHHNYLESGEAVLSTVSRNGPGDASASSCSRKLKLMLPERSLSRSVESPATLLACYRTVHRRRTIGHPVGLSSNCTLPPNDKTVGTTTVALPRSELVMNRLDHHSNILSLYLD